MPAYLFQGSYSAETWARLIQRPEDREASLRAAAEQHGGRLLGLWFTFGADDVVVLAELPDAITAGAIAMAMAASGAFRNLRTTPLITSQEAMAMMSRAGQLSFRPAGA